MGGDPCYDIGKLLHDDAHLHLLARFFLTYFLPAVFALHVGEHINGGFCFMKETFTFAHGNLPLQGKTTHVLLLEFFSARNVALRTK